MSHFVSDLITLVTVSTLGGAIALGHVSMDAEPAAEDVLVASTDLTAIPQAVTEEVQAAAVVEPTVIAEAAFESIPQAQLLQVSFVTTEEELFPSARSAARGGNGTYGRVTGSSVNLRTGPGTNFAVAGRAVRDQEMAVTGETDGRWVQVIVADVNDPVWIHGKFFKTP